VKTLISSTTPEYWRAKSNPSRSQSNNKERGYQMAWHAKTLAAMTGYDFLKNQRELRSKHASDSTLPLIEKQGFIGFEGSV